jgi:hypothetical protein
MKPEVLGSWIFGAVTVTFLVALHWLAFRVGKKRRRASQSAHAHMGRVEISDEPIIPR